MERPPLLDAAAGGNLPVLRQLVENGAHLDVLDSLGFAAIHLAAKYGNPETVDYLLQQRPEWLDARDATWDSTPFLHAACGSNVPVLRQLFEKGADLNAQDNDMGSAAIHLAAQFGNTEAVDFLLQERPLWLEARSSRLGQTPLLHAAYGGNLAVLILLLERGADLDVETSRVGLAAIHVAAKHGNIETVQYLLEQRPEWLDAGDARWGQTPLLHAACGGNLPVLRQLLEKGADLDVHDRESGANAIHMAAWRGNIETVAYLLQLRPQWLEVRSRRVGRTPLLQAAWRGNLNVLKFLLERGADLDVQDSDTGSKAIHLAAWGGNTETIDYLLQRRPQWLEVRSRKWGQTPLLHAAAAAATARSNFPVLQLLLERGADFDARDWNTGSAAIHLAAQFGNNEKVTYLLQQRPDWLEARSAKVRRTPLLHAAYGGNLAVLELLVENGADPLARDRRANNALHLAAFSGNVDVCSFLATRNPSMIEQENEDGRRPIDVARLRNKHAVIALLNSLR